MPVNPAGTSPGLSTPTAADLPKVHIKCKREACDSILAVEIKHAGMTGGRHMYQCAKCKSSWVVNTGGAANF